MRVIERERGTLIVIDKFPTLLAYNFSKEGWNMTIEHR